MEDLLNAMMSGAGEEAGDEGQNDDPRAGIPGSMLGGSRGGQAGAMGGLMQALLGGGLGAGAQGSGMESIMGALLGGGDGSVMANNPLVEPMAEALVEKLGLSQETAETVAGFALSKLLSGLLGGSATHGGRSARTESNQIMSQLRSGEGIDPGYLSSTGMTQELVDQTGLDPETAERSLQEALEKLGRRMLPGSRPAPQQDPDLSQGLDGLINL